MKIAAAVLCVLLSLAFLFFTIDATGSLQDAPPTRGQQKYEVPLGAGCVLFGVAGVALLVSHARQRRQTAMTAFDRAQRLGHGARSSLTLRSDGQLGPGTAANDQGQERTRAK